MCVFFGMFSSKRGTVKVHGKEVGKRKTIQTGIQFMEISLAGFHYHLAIYLLMIMELFFSPFA